MPGAPTLQALSEHQSPNLLFEAVAGSQAYGLAMADSDLDLRGVYAMPAASYLSLTAPPAQIHDDRHNQVYYSLRRLMELLAAGNPNMIELLHTPSDCVRFQSPIWTRLQAQREEFISQRSVESLIGYAQGQISKARGQNKWINQPQPEAAPTPTDHCYYLPTDAATQGGPPLRPLALDQAGIDLQRHHAARVEHAHDLYRLYDYGDAARGVFRQGQLVCESIPLDDERARFAGLLLYNRQGYERALADHQNYWTWRRERNPARWQLQDAGELDYDAKNLMHTLRLLRSAQQMIDHGEPLVRVDAATREYLLAIRAGKHDYASLSAEAQRLVAQCRQALATSALPAHCPVTLADRLLREMTADWEESCR